MRTILDYLIYLVVLTIGALLGGPIGFILAIVLLSYVINSRSTIDKVPTKRYVSTIITKVPSEYYKEYRKYLRSNGWKVLGRQVKKRDNHHCVRCGYIGNLQVHHTNYNGIETMSFTVDQLESVCKECHTDIHLGLLPMKKKDQ